MTDDGARVAEEIEGWIHEESERRREEASALGWVDVGVWLGQPVGFPYAQELPAPELPGYLSRYGMAGALVSHWDSVRLSAQEGNAALLDSEAELPESTWTIWTGLPLFPREQDPIPGGTVSSGRIRGVRLFPKTHRYPLASWTVGSLCAWMRERRIPLFLQHVETEWREVYELAHAHPELRIVVESQWQKILYHIRPLYGLLQSCPQVLLEISNFAAADLLAHAARELGAERLMYGSFAPVSDPFVGMGMILDSGLSAEQKALIAGGNARGLIAAVAL